LPDVAVVPSEHFNTVLWTGDGGSNRAVTGVNFEPNFVWIKSRSITGYGLLFDAVRGANKKLYSSLTNAEFSDTDALLSFEADGFNVGDDNGTNQNSATYVAWNWKANGSGSSNTDGSITSTVSANTDAGFSIVSYTGTASNATVGHGLSKAPEMVIAKNRSDGSYWIVGTDDLTSWSRYIPLNLTNAETNAPTQFNSTAPTSTVFSIGTNADVNGSGHNIIAYCFHSVDGYSKVGSYTGNSNADGTFVYTGFKPAYVMRKRSDSTGHWFLNDNKREGYNGSGSNDVLYPNGSYAEGDADRIDLLSNGFKVRTTDGDVNTGTIIYIAFASVPFKFSNAR
jgi:hypothetical protein